MLNHGWGHHREVLIILYWPAHGVSQAFDVPKPTVFGAQNGRGEPQGNVHCFFFLCSAKNVCSCFKMHDEEAFEQK